MSEVMTGSETEARTDRPAAPDVRTSSLRAARIRRRLIVHTTQLAVMAVVYGGWQLMDSTGHLDPTLFGKPSGIVSRLHTWIRDGTAIGSLADQIKVTLEEALLGFVIGTSLGVISGIALGRVRFLADVFGPFIKVLNSIPRIVLGSV
ncbi:MAG: transporter permease, partial [Pseudonocardiales bacterium]|nr:transporter permease [Pseudonocardiales bacterium]